MQKSAIRIKKVGKHNAKVDRAQVPIISAFFSRNLYHYTVIFYEMKKIMKKNQNVTQNDVKECDIKEGKQFQ